MKVRTEPASTQKAPPNTRGHLTEAAYEFLKGGLLEGRYRPGERISLEQVVEAVGASRQPVMDAIRRLSVEGFLKVVPQSGCLVALPEAQEVGDFLRMLAAIEGTCAELAAQRASDEEIRCLQQIVSDYLEQLPRDMNEQQIAHSYRLHNREFHHKLHSMAKSEIVSSLVLSLSDRADFYIANAIGTLNFGSRFEEAVEEHRRLAEVLGWRDPEAAKRLVVSHVLAFIDSIGLSQGDRPAAVSTARGR